MIRRSAEGDVMTVLHNPQRIPPQPKAWNVFTLWVLHTPLLQRLARSHVCELRFRGRRSGREVRLPVMYAQRGDTVVILVGRSDRKRWWRNFRSPHRVDVLLPDAARTGMGRVVQPGNPERMAASRIYSSRFPRVTVGNAPMVVIDLDPVP